MVRGMARGIARGRGRGRGRDGNAAGQRRRRPAPPRVVGDLDNLPSFNKRIGHQNQHHGTARSVCELCIPLHFARRHGIDKDRSMTFVTRSLVADGGRLHPYMYMRMWFRNVDRNNGNFVIRFGWREFSEYHQLKRNWILRFTLTAPNQLYVRRVKQFSDGMLAGFSDDEDSG